MLLFVVTISGLVPMIMLTFVDPTASNKGEQLMNTFHKKAVWMIWISNIVVSYYYIKRGAVKPPTPCYNFMHKGFGRSHK